MLVNPLCGETIKNKPQLHQLKKEMKKLYKAALLAALGLGSITAAQATNFTVNDLYLGFTKSTASQDEYIDLGNLSSFNATGVTDLSSYLGGLTDFNTTFGSSATSVGMAVVGANNSNVVNPFGVFATALRTGGAGADPTVAGSNLSAKSHSSSVMSGGAGVVASLLATEGIALPSAGSSLLSGNGVADSYLTKIAATASTQQNFWGKTGFSPNSTIGATGTIYEDLWAATTTSAYTYEGYFTFNYSADQLTFTSSAVAVPEPTTYGMLAGAGLLAVSLRRQFNRKNA
jgi:hypothetical protein